MNTLNVNQLGLVELSNTEMIHAVGGTGTTTSNDCGTCGHNSSSSSNSSRSFLGIGLHLDLSLNLATDNQYHTSSKSYSC
jgi:hypothetical protein